MRERRLGGKGSVGSWRLKGAEFRSWATSGFLGLRQSASESGPRAGEVGDSETIGCSRGSSYAPSAPLPWRGGVLPAGRKTGRRSRASREGRGWAGLSLSSALARLDDPGRKSQPHPRLPAGTRD